MAASQTAKSGNSSRTDVQSEHSPLLRSDKQPGRDVLDYLKAYAREKPEVAALWCFGIGFVMGWKLKPW